MILTAIATDQIHLIFHQGDQRRYNDRTTFTHQCRQLITQTLSASRGLDDKCVLAGQYALYDALLIALELVETKIGSQCGTKCITCMINMNVRRGYTFFRGLICSDDLIRFLSGFFNGCHV